MKTRATQDREYWTLRKHTCAACGERARHYLASWDSQNAPQVFGIPYASHNGGIGREISADERDVRLFHLAGIHACDVYLSECCDVPLCSMAAARKVEGTRGRVVFVFDSVRYRCLALGITEQDDNGSTVVLNITRCRLARDHTDEHLAANETRAGRNVERRWS